MDEKITRDQDIEEIKKTLREQFRLLSERSFITHNGIELSMITTEMRKIAMMFINLL